MKFGTDTLEQVIDLAAGEVGWELGHSFDKVVRLNTLI